MPVERRARRCHCESRRAIMGAKELPEVGFDAGSADIRQRLTAE